MEKTSHITTFEEILDNKYCERGTPEREQWEKEFESYKTEEIAVIHLESSSSLGAGLKKILEHKQLRQQFWNDEISLDELNQSLKEKGINKQYKHDSEV